MDNSSGQIYFGITLHNHQPEGNFHWVFQQAYEQAYLPMIEAIERHPSLNFSLHYSGSLIDWLKENHPDFIQKLAELVARGQVEIMGGGYYEPILPAIPDADKLGQITKMSSFIGHQFGSRPTGLWLTERVWEPHLAKILAQAEIQWTLVDDAHFKWVGMEDKDLLGYYVTEEQGYSLNIFPISKRLRYLIPWRSVGEAIDFFRSKASDQAIKIAVLGDDGEKFGIWPYTYKRCWQEGWVEDFFTTLEENQDWLHTIKLTDYVEKFPPLGRIYLPCAAYDEMVEWALPSNKSWYYTSLKRQLEAEGRQDIIQFMCGGFWRHFLVKYPEANHMHKKALFVHKKVQKAKSLGKRDCGEEELWKAQCNEPYWHGVFGGIYLPHLRANTYRHLLLAENKADNILYPGGKLKYEKFDFDSDGYEEVILEGDAFSLYFSPKDGGSLFEWDLHGHAYNLLSTLTRRPEAYHWVLSEVNQSEEDKFGKALPSLHDQIRIKDKGLCSPVYDLYLRSSLRDHFLNSSLKLEDFAQSSYDEAGDFVDKPYEVLVEKKGSRLELCLWRDGNIFSQGKQLPFQVRKATILENGKRILSINYQLINKSDATVEGIFGSEWNINLLSGKHDEQTYYRVSNRPLKDYYLDSKGELRDIGAIFLANKRLGLQIALRVKPKVTLWCFPVETISNSEEGIEKIYQGSCFLFLLPFKLAGGASLNLKLTWSV